MSVSSTSLTSSGCSPRLFISSFNDQFHKAFTMIDLSLFTINSFVNKYRPMTCSLARLFPSDGIRVLFTRDRGRERKRKERQSMPVICPSPRRIWPMKVVYPTRKRIWPRSSVCQGPRRTSTTPGVCRVPRRISLMRAVWPDPKRDGDRSLPIVHHCRTRDSLEQCSGERGRGRREDQRGGGVVPAYPNDE